MEPNNILTASRMSCLQRCPRAHYWQFEIGLRKEIDGLALIIGSAMHRAFEARWKLKATYEQALTAALADKSMDEYTCATIAGLLAGYYHHWSDDDFDVVMHSEIQFEDALEGSRTFALAGKLDRLGEKSCGTKVMVEYKTTGESLNVDSSYWLRLRFNSQLFQYYLAARTAGWEIEEVIYDVTRKPSIRPKQIADLDKDGKKIVKDKDGNRVFKKNGEPRESGSEADGCFVQHHLETPDEFSTRLAQDCIARPEFYFARREVPILEDDLEEFKAQRYALAKMIMHYRTLSQTSRLSGPKAWPRNVSEQTCKFCAYSSFCLQNLTIDPANPPQGFAVKPFNPELQDNSNEYETSASSN